MLGLNWHGSGWSGSRMVATICYQNCYYAVIAPSIGPDSSGQVARSLLQGSTSVCSASTPGVRRASASASRMNAMISGATKIWSLFRPVTSRRIPASMSFRTLYAAAAWVTSRSFAAWPIVSDGDWKSPSISFCSNAEDRADWNWPRYRSRNWSRPSAWSIDSSEHSLTPCRKNLIQLDQSPVWLTLRRRSI